MRDQIEAARQRCVLYDLTPAGRLFVSGPDAALLLAETLDLRRPRDPRVKPAPRR